MNLLAIVGGNGSRPNGLLDSRNLMAMQHLAGNSAVVRLLDSKRAPMERPLAEPGIIQRQPAAPKASDQISDLQKRTAVLEKQQASTALDLEFRGIIGKRLSVYRQTIYRLTGGFQTAMTNFQTTQRVQAEFDAIKAQLIATLISTGAASLYEPALNAAFGKLGKILEKDAKWVTKWTEQLENPLNAFTAGAGSTVATGQAIGATEKGQAPPTTGGVSAGDPLTYLSQNLDVVETHTQAFEGAFSERGSAQTKTKTEEWAKWSPEAQRAAYMALIAELDAAHPPTADKLKPAEELARIIERYMWAAWIVNNVVPIVKSYGESGKKKTNKERTAEDYADVAMDIGTVVEDRLNAVGAKPDTVTLTGHWYSSNKPGNWNVLLYVWARDYAEKLTT